MTSRALRLGRWSTTTGLPWEDFSAGANGLLFPSCANPHEESEQSKGIFVQRERPLRVSPSWRTGTGNSR